MKFLILLLYLFQFHEALSQARRNDVIIDEIMADPSPSVGLPTVEYIEIKNISSIGINLNGWKLGTASGFGSINSNFVIQPGFYLLLCAGNSLNALSAYGPAIAVTNFPSLDNEGELLTLISNEGKTIHAVEYEKSWYQNAVKENGGWSLEMIDTKNVCGGKANWIASNSLNGGTPGKINTVDGVMQDNSPPSILHVFSIDSLSLVIVFNEPLDSSSIINGHFEINEGIGPPRAINMLGPLFDKVILHLSIPLQPGKIYVLSISSVMDCSGNMSQALSANAGLSTIAYPFDVIINEVLFNPKGAGKDYAELYNRSSGIFDLKDLYLASRAVTGSITMPVRISKISYPLFPNQYIVVTEDGSQLKRDFLVKDTRSIVELRNFPSLPDASGDLVVLNLQGSIVDELKYEEGWHFKLIDNKQGVALERISFNKPTQDPQNWQSASSTSGYGTPGYENSQVYLESLREENINVSPEVFSPDNDGITDLTFINYQFGESGYVMNVTVFNISGKPVRYLVRNGLCGTKGYFRWDGLDENYKALKPGVYILFIEVFNLKGHTKKYKKVITLLSKV